MGVPRAAQALAPRAVQPSRGTAGLVPNRPLIYQCFWVIMVVRSRLTVITGEMNIPSPDIL
jgi:hypothetical protein